MPIFFTKNIYSLPKAECCRWYTQYLCIVRINWIRNADTMIHGLLYLQVHVWLYSDKINSVVSNAFLSPKFLTKNCTWQFLYEKEPLWQFLKKREYLTVSHKKWERIFNSFLEKICTFDSFLQKWECTFYSFLQKRMPIWQFLI